MILLNGSTVAATIRQDLIQQVRALCADGASAPHLAIILVGNDLASHTYVKAKRKACQEVGFQSTLIQYEVVQESVLLQQITQINKDSQIDGLIVQLPLPGNISVPRVMQHIHPEKDVDGFHPLNYGNLALGKAAHVPATPLGILTLLKHYAIPTQGKYCVIVGRSRIVGAPLSILMGRDSELGNATVTLCHHHTQDLDAITRQADILITATGQPKLITADMVKKGAVVVDVGITRVPSNKHKTGYYLQGDVDFAQVAPRCSYITPVPGGVGPMTIAALLLNTLRAARNRG